MLWEKEIDQEYAFHLAALRMNQDVDYLTEECDNLITKLGDAQAVNLSLRKNLRALEREIYTMCHKNVHNSCVIDDLQELDEQAKETHITTAEIQHKKNLMVKEQHNCKEIISMLRREILLLEHKAEMDTSLLETIKPHRQKLKNMLEIEKLNSHQKTQEYLRDLLEMLRKYQEANSIYKENSKDSINKMAKLQETFLATDTHSRRDIPESESDMTIIASSNHSLPPNDPDLKDDASELNAEIKHLEEENEIIFSIIIEFFPRMKDRFMKFINQCSLMYEIDNETGLIEEYVKRLHRVRLKKESEVEKIDFESCESIEEKKIVLNIKESEEQFLRSILCQFILRSDEDFQMFSIFQSKFKELGLESL